MKRTDPIVWLCGSIVICMLCATAQSAEGAVRAQTYPFSLAEKPGRHAVGFKVVEQYDPSRPFRPSIDSLGRPWKGETARPIQTLVWYPAQKPSSKRMTVGEYVALGATEGFGAPKILSGLSEWLVDGMKPSFAQTLLAVRDARPAGGHFPVVIYAPSFSSGAWENADLCEYLASHGYVVIASPAMGVGPESTHDVAGLNAQARDISFLIGYAGTLANADVSEVAVAGFSWGGLAGLFAAARDNRIDALVALDGSMRYYPGLVQQAADVVPEQMTLPLLYFKAQSSIENQSFNSGPSVPSAWLHGDLVEVLMLGLVHPEFASMAHRNERLWQYEFANMQQGDYTREDGVIGYAWVARYTREFLDAYLKHDTSAMKFLENKPAANGVPLHVMGVKVRSAKPLPASLTSFKIEVDRQGFDHAAEIYASLQGAEPEFKLDPEELLSWGHALIADGHFAQAIRIMQLGVLLEPSSRAYASLGDAYRHAGETQQARSSYEKALEKDPNNFVIEETLAGLETDASASR